MMLKPEDREEGAAFAFRVASECCVDSDNDWGCTGYHALWQYLRFTGIQPSISRDHSVLSALLHEALLGVDAPHVLISGAADYGLLELLGEWSHVTKRSVTVDVVDRCETPLRVNRWFAEKAGLSLQCYHCDFRYFTPSTSYDLVAAHSFISMFELSERQALVEKWSSLLKPKGHLLTTTRVYKTSRARKRARPDVRETNDRLIQLLDGLKLKGWNPPCAEPELLNLLREIYLQRPAKEIVVGAQLFEMLQNAGFSLSQLRKDEAAAPGVDSLVGSPEGLHVSERITLLAVKT